MKVIKKLLIGLILGGTLVSCGYIEPTAPLQPTQVVKSVDISVDQDKSINKTNNVYDNIPTQLIATIIYADSTIEDRTDIKWASDDPRKMIVSTTGIVTLPKTIARNTLNEIIGTFGFDADDKQVEGIVVLTAMSTTPSLAIAPINPTLIKTTKTLQLKANATYADTDTDIIDVTTLSDWSVDVNNNATVDNGNMKGKVTYKSNGVTVVTAKFSNEMITTTVTTTENKPVLESITVDVDPAQGTDNIPKGAKKRLRAMGTYNIGGEQTITADVTWISDTEASITVTNTGKKGVAEAIAGDNSPSNITAELNNVTSDPILILTAVAPVLSEAKIQFGDGTISAITPPTLTGTNTDGTAVNPAPTAGLFRWSVSNIVGAATIDRDTGVVTPTDNGSINVNATLRNRGDLPGIPTTDTNVTITGQ